MVSKKRERGQKKRHAPQPQVDVTASAWQQPCASAQPVAQQIAAHSRHTRARAQRIIKVSNRLARAVRHAQSRVNNFRAHKSGIKMKKLKRALRRAKAHARRHARKHARTPPAQLKGLKTAFLKLEIN